MLSMLRGRQLIMLIIAAANRLPLRALKCLFNPVELFFIEIIVRCSIGIGSTARVYNVRSSTDAADGTANCLSLWHTSRRDTAGYS